MHVNKVLNVWDVLYVEYFIRTREKVNLWAHDVGKERLE